MADENEQIDATSVDDSIITEEIECEADPDSSELGIDDNVLGAAPPVPAVNTQLPSSGTSFYSYAANRNKQWGLKTTIQAIEAIATAWNAKYPGSRPLGIGNISFRGGGTMPPHSSHKRGVDVDFRPQRNDGAKSPVTYQDSAYSQQKTQELVNVIRGNSVLQVDLILFNDSGVTGVRSWAGHDNHLHVRFK
jgi:murein endopeptidase